MDDDEGGDADDGVGEGIVILEHTKLQGRFFMDMRHHHDGPHFQVGTSTAD